MIGPWAKLTKLKWRWSQFRFEVLFTTPDITLTKVLLINYHIMFVGKEILEDRSLLEARPVSSSLASWVVLLQDLYAVALKTPKSDLMLKDPLPLICVPQLGQVTRSWDFVPPEVVRPLASSTLDPCHLGTSPNSIKLI